MNSGKMGCGAVWNGGGGFSPEGGRACRRLEHGSWFQRFVEAVGSSWAERKGNGGELADLKVSKLEGLN